ncbi:MAG: sulfatase-like hydrolase/transferase, partial [Myxococcota bacterium]|nr:sulfatase-like hydrolase/transferase [Myxococcota bacterium]
MSSTRNETPLQPPPATPSTGLVVGAVTAGGLLGVLDTIQILAADSLPWDGIRALLLLTSTSVALAATAGLTAIACRALPGMPNSRWTGFVVGLGAVLLLDLAEWWFTEPPPWTETFPLRGHPLLFLIALGAGGWAGRGLMRRPTTARWVLLATTTLGLCRAVWVHRSTPGSIQGTTDSPNLLIVTLDTTRADHMHGEGQNPSRTPHFDALASDGVSFSTAIAQIPVTGPSHITLLTGQGPWRHGNLLNGLPIPDRGTWLPTQLRQNGWRTA